MRDQIKMLMVDLKETQVESYKFVGFKNVLMLNNPLALTGKMLLLVDSLKPRMIARARNSCSQLYSCDCTVTNYFDYFKKKNEIIDIVLLKTLLCQFYLYVFEQSSLH